MKLYLIVENSLEEGIQEAEVLEETNGTYKVQYEICKYLTTSKMNKSTMRACGRQFFFSYEEAKEYLIERCAKRIAYYKDQISGIQSLIERLAKVVEDLDNE